MSPPHDDQHFRDILRLFPEEAVIHFFTRYYNNLISMALKNTRDPMVAEDIVQEAFLELWKRRKQLSQYHEKSILGYLVRIVKLQTINYYRYLDKARMLQDEYRNGKHFPLTQSPIEVTLIEHEARMEIIQLIKTFPQREQECLLLKINHEMVIDQIASHLNLSRKAVERSLYSGTKRLRKQWILLRQ